MTCFLIPDCHFPRDQSPACNHYRGPLIRRKDDKEMQIKTAGHYLFLLSGWQRLENWIPYVGESVGKQALFTIRGAVNRCVIFLEGSLKTLV